MKGFLTIGLIVALTTFWNVEVRANIPTIPVSGPHYTNNCEPYYLFDGRIWNGHFNHENVTKLRVSFGDGSSYSVVDPGSPGDMTFQHSYSVSGNYQITVEVWLVGGSPLTSPPDNIYTTSIYGVASTSSWVPDFIAMQNGGVTNFIFTGDNTGANLTGFLIDFGDGVTDSGPPIQNGSTFASHQYATAGSYTVTVTQYYTIMSGEEPIGECTWTNTLVVEVTPGDECCSNFAPIVEEEYWLSAWVREEVAPVKTYSNSYVELEFVGSSTSNIQFQPSGDLVDGWQRIVGKFTVPANTTDLKIHLVNNRPSGDVYFDDVRVHPFNASMKSYVYDPETLWLTAELDDNNYATFYEYDLEGQLVRIKKETARGIMTIQESRSSNPKE